MSEGVIPKVGLHHASKGEVIGLILRARNLVDDHLFFRLKIALCQSWVHHVTQELDGALQVFAQYPCIIDGGFVRGKGIQFGTNLVKFQGDLLPVERLGALEDHMLQEMRNACDTWVWLVT